MLQQLERRICLSNTTIHAVEDVLFIQGDRSDNAIRLRSISGQTGRKLLIEGLNGTRLNGSRRDLILPDTFTTIHLDLHDGNDYVRLVGLRFDGAIRINPGDGDDRIQTLNSRIREDFIVGSSDGVDSLFADETDFLNDLKFDDSSDASEIRLRHSDVDDNLTLVTGSSIDVIRLNATDVYGKSRIDPKDGRDSVRVENSFFKDDISLTATKELDDVYFEMIKRFDFDRDDNGWSFDAADYRLGPGRPISDYRLESGIRTVEPTSGPSRRGFYLKGYNTSDDLFLFITREFDKADGVVAEQAYMITFDVRLSTRLPSNASNRPSHLAVGAFARRPNVGPIEEPDTTEQSREYRLFGNTEGVRAAYGTELNLVASIVGDHTQVLGAPHTFTKVFYSHIFSQSAQANGHAQVWLLTGIESTFESGFEHYIESINVRFSPVKEPD